MPATDYPKGWKFCGVQQSRDPQMTGMQVIEVRKVFQTAPGTAAEIILQAQTRDQLIQLAEDYEWWMQRTGQKGHIFIAQSEVARLINDSMHLSSQVKELQAHSTLQEEQLRAYRRVEFSKEQHERLKTDLEETTTRVLKSYGMEPKHEVPLPRLAVSSVAVNGA